MKGVVFNVLEDFTDENFGEGEFDEIVDNVELETKDPFVGPGTYPDKDLFSIVGEIVKKKSLKLDWALRAFGKFLFIRLVNINPDFAKNVKGVLEFLPLVETIIHIEVKKLFPGAVPPAFKFSNIKENSLEVEYISGRQLCFLMEGLIEGAADYFGDKIEYKQLNCHHIDKTQTCLFLVKRV